MSDAMFRRMQQTRIHNLEQELKKYEWVSVKDRLPEKDGFYLAWYTFKGNGHTRDIFYYNCGSPMPSAITHWMALPEPPKENNYVDDR